MNIIRYTVFECDEWPYSQVRWYGGLMFTVWQALEDGNAGAELDAFTAAEARPGDLAWAEDYARRYFKRVLEGVNGA